MYNQESKQNNHQLHVHMFQCLYSKRVEPQPSQTLNLYYQNNILLNIQVVIKTKLHQQYSKNKNTSPYQLLMQIELILKKCHKHAKLMDAVCLSGQCTAEILLCDQCCKDKHPHFNIPIPQFRTLFNQKIAEKRSKLQMINYDETPIDLIAKNYKAEIDQEQLKMIEGIMKELREDKKIIFEELIRASVNFNEKCSKQLKKVQGIKQMKDYDPVTLLMKLKMSTPDKIAAIRDSYLTLNKLTDEELLVLREQKALKNRLIKFVKEKNLGDFFGKLKQIVTEKRSQVKAAIMKPQQKRGGSNEKSSKRSNIFDRRRSSDELAPSPKPGIRY